MTAISSKRFHMVCLFFVALLAYSPVLRNGFVYDDHTFIVGNKYIKSFDIRQILLTLNTGIEYFPLRDISWSLDFFLWGANPFAFHLTGLLLYALTAVVVYFLFVEMSALLSGSSDSGLRPASAYPSFLAAILFTVHPVHTEVVAAIFNRGSLLSGLFSYLSCFLFLRYMRGGNNSYRYYAGALFCYLCALLSKQYGIVVPAVLLLFILCDIRPNRGRQLLMTLPFFSLALVFLVFFKTVAASANLMHQLSDSVTSDLTGKLAVATQIMVYYAAKTIVPGETVAEYAVSFSQSLMDRGTAGSLSASIIVLLAAFMVRRRYPQILFGLLLYLICLLPVLNFFGTHPVVADRYVFLPGIGLFFAMTAVPLVNKHKIIPFLCLAVAVWWSISSMRQVTYWKDDITLWKHNTRFAPSFKAYLYLGYAYFNAHDYAKAEDMLRRVRDMDPLDETYDIFQGNMLFLKGEYAAAAQAFEEGFAKKSARWPAPDKVGWEVYFNAATAHRKAGNLAYAIRYYEKSIALKPNHIDSLNSLGITFREMKQYGRAIEAFEKAISLDADYSLAPFNLAVTYLETGDRANAEKYAALIRERFPRLRSPMDALMKNRGW